MKTLLLPFRALVFLLGWFSYNMEMAADWVVGVPRRSEYVKTGSCNRCGKCCRCLALILPKGMSRHGLLVKLVSIWHRVLMNFYFIGEEEGWLIYGCNYYREEKDGEKAGCSIYPFRHRLCRFFPRTTLYGHPSIHEDCGYKFVKRSVLIETRVAKANGRKTFGDVLEDKKTITHQTILKSQ